MNNQIIEIEPKNIYDTFGNVTGTCDKVEVTISYNLGDEYAMGIGMLLNENNIPCGSQNKKIPTEGWGENDDVMYDRFLELINLKRKLN